MGSVVKTANWDVSSGLLTSRIGLERSRIATAAVLGREAVNRLLPWPRSARSAVFSATVDRARPAHRRGGASGGPTSGSMRVDELVDRMRALWQQTKRQAGPLADCLAANPRAGPNAGCALRDPPGGGHRAG